MTDREDLIAALEEVLTQCAANCADGPDEFQRMRMRLIETLSYVTNSEVRSSRILSDGQCYLASALERLFAATARNR